jgi:outer membrane protein TolC
LIEAVGVNTLEEIPATVSDELPTDVPEMSFTLQDCIGFIQTNNLDVQIAKLQMNISDAKIKINRAKFIRNFILTVFTAKRRSFCYRSFGINDILSIAAKLSWSLWGNSLSASYSTDRTDPTEIVDASKRVETTTMDISFQF